MLVSFSYQPLDDENDMRVVSNLLNNIYAKNVCLGNFITIKHLIVSTITIRIPMPSSLNITTSTLESTVLIQEHSTSPDEYAVLSRDLSPSPVSPTVELEPR